MAGVSMFCDGVRARRLEAAEAAGSAAFNAAAAGLFPEMRPASLAAGGGVALYYEPGTPLNGVKGMGMNGAVAPEELDAVEAFFRQRACPVVIDLCPLADAGLWKELMARGYRVMEFETVLFRALGAEERFDWTVEGLSLEVASGEDLDVGARTLAEGFSETTEPTPFMTKIGRVLSRVPGSTMLLARVGGEVAGAACMRVHKGVAWLHGTATLPAWRGRGIQGALIRERLGRAREAGCDLVKVEARPGTTSQRNAERAGFCVAYTRPQIRREW